MVRIQWHYSTYEVVEYGDTVVYSISNRNIFSFKFRCNYTYKYK